MNSLLPNNATPQEEAIDLATARIGGIEVPNRSLWNPDTCPADLLPWLAWAFSVDQWDAEWSVEQKRAIVAASLFVHKRKGTPAAVKEVVDLIFGGGDVVEPWQASDLDPHQFKIVTTGLLQSQTDFDKLIELVDSTKPVRSWLVAVQVRRSATERVYLGMFSQIGTTTGVNNRLTFDIDALGLFYGTAQLVATTTQIQPRA